MTFASVSIVICYQEDYSSSANGFWRSH